LNGKDGPILKYSEVFAPGAPSENVFYQRRKQKMDLSKVDLEEVCEPDEEEDFDTTQEPSEYASVRPSADMDIVEAEIGHPLKPDAKIESNLGEHAFALLEQQSWEDKIVWSSEGLEKQELSIVARRSLQSHSKKKPEEPPKSQPQLKEEPMSSLPDSMPVPALLKAQATVPKVITATPEVKAEIKSHLFKPNDELETGKWVESIIWDDNVPPKVAPPTDLVLDLNDKYVFPEDPMKRFGNAPSVNVSSPTNTRRGRKRKFEPSEDGIDFFNLSNDKYYKTSGGKVRQKLGKTTVVHSVPALKLSIYKPFLSDLDLTHFHRPQAKIKPGYTYRVNIFRPEDAVTSGGAFQGQVKEMRHKGDLSSREGRVVLLEYTEEHPLVLSNVGMGSKIKNYYRKRNPNEHPFLRHEDGENVFLDPSDPSPFLGEVEEGKTVHSVDNNLFIAPVAKHSVSQNDFLLVKIDNKFYIREIPAIYTVGQLQPKMEVYAPNSRAVSNFSKNRLQAYIYRLFMNKKVDQHRIRINEIVRLFPGSSEAVIRKKLKECADFQRGGDENGYWTVKDQGNMPSEEDVRALVTPEQVCLCESMQEGQFRLNQNGVKKFTTITPAFTAALQNIDNDRNADEKLRRTAHLLEEELLLTPWNLTSNFVGVVHEGKGMLQLTGLGDPSGGRGEGFSYLRMPIKNFDKKKKEEKPKVSVTGTDADLRKLSLENSRLVLLRFGVPDDQIQKMGRWERIAMVRAKSNEAANSGASGLKFARGNRFSLQQQMTNYKEQSQLIFNNQVQAISAANAVLSDDEPEEGEEDSDLDDLTTNIESMLESKAKKNAKNRQEVEEDENEKEEFEKLMMDTLVDNPKGATSSVNVISVIEAKEITPEMDQQLMSKASSAPGRPLDNSDLSEPTLASKGVVLRRKVYKNNPDGTRTERVEVVTDPRQIEAFLQKERERERKVRTGVARRARQLSMEEEEERNKIKREKRRLQEQLRRLKKKKQNEFENTGVKFSACGMVGHMKNNRLCPLYPATSGTESPQMKLYDDDDEDIDEYNYSPGTPASRSGITIKIKKGQLSHEAQRELLLARRRRRKGSAAALVSLSNLFEKIMKDVKDHTNAFPFLKPVAPNDRFAPDYHQVISRPVDISKIRENIKANKYINRKEFLSDVELMRNNCYTYNKDRNPHLLPMVDVLVEIVKKGIKANEFEISEFEKEIINEQSRVPSSKGEEDMEDDSYWDTVDPNFM